MSILETKGLVRDFGRLRAVNQVDLMVEEGELTAIIGPNGAGKTTLFNLITGRLRPTAGRVIFQQQDITGLPPSRIARLGISRTFQVTHIFPELSIFDNVKIAVLSRRGETARLFSASDRLPEVDSETEEVLSVLGLAGRWDTPCVALSHGEQRHVELGIALALGPKLLLLDEPTAGMAPQETAEMVAFIRDLAHKQNVTILLTEHDMEVVFSIAQRIVVMHQGSIIADGTPGEVRGDVSVREAYLGE
ncbi:MAG: ABC transporter ATP-binding protein [Anaerolineae bacterium]